MWTLIFGALKFVPGLAEKFLDWQVKRANVDLQGFTVGANVDLAAYQAYVAAQVETNRMKLAQNQWWGAKVIILLAGVPAATHFALVMIDSMCPATWHYNLVAGVAKGGCGYGITALPAPYATYEWLIVQSFFIVAPVMTVSSAVSQWLGRKR